MLCSGVAQGLQAKGGSGHAVRTGTVPGHARRKVCSAQRLAIPAPFPSLLLSPACRLATEAGRGKAARCGATRPLGGTHEICSSPAPPCDHKRDRKKAIFFFLGAPQSKFTPHPHTHLATKYTPKGFQCVASLGRVWDYSGVRPIGGRAGSAKPATELRRRITARRGFSVKCGGVPSQKKGES